MPQNYFGLTGFRLNFMIAVVAGTAFWLFGYDMGVLGGVITEDAFLNVFPEMRDPAVLGIVIGIFEIGCLIGALSCMEIGDRLGRRKTVCVGMFMLVVGGVLQTAAFNLGTLIAGRIISGLGLGIDVATVPTWQSECSKPHRRGQLVMIEGAMCTIGLACAQWIGFGFFFYGNDPRQWRPVVALQCAPALIVFVLILFLPESPRWLVKKGRMDEAHYVLSRLADRPMDDPDVIEDLESIKASFESQKGAAPFKYRELLEGGKTQTFRRVLLGFFIQSAQQISGINMVATYANTIIASSFRFDSMTSHLLAACVGTEYAMCSCLSLLFIERVGRRKIFMITASGMSLSFVVISALLSTGGRTEQIAGAAFLFVFNSFFGFAWVGGPFLYSAEIAPLRVRAHANAIASSGNWIFCFIVVMTIPASFANLGWKTYIIYAIFNACFVPVIYFFLPETAGRSLEDLDVIFAAGGNPVKVEQAMPKSHINHNEARKALGLATDGTPENGSVQEVNVLKNEKV